MAFHFKLESVLQVRCLEEENCQKKLADALHLYEEESAHLRKLLAMQKKAEEEIAEKMKTAMTGPQSIMYHHYVKKLSERINTQKKRVVEIHSVCHVKREQLIQALKKRKAIETLKTKDQETYTDELNHEEEKFINEIAITRFHLNLG